ncbi:hypothetical protein EDB89DRAFT_2241564 [Lactarius sanguifluus]|nr:hypothetical protein EDB89DRAFT_2241564 [Lactarius sanguifluus]
MSGPRSSPTSKASTAATIIVPAKTPKRTAPKGSHSRHASSQAKPKTADKEAPPPEGPGSWPYQIHARESWLRSGLGIAAVVVVVGMRVIGNDYDRHHGCRRCNGGGVSSSELYEPCSEALKLVRECVVKVAAGTWAHDKAHGAGRRGRAEVSVKRGKKPRTHHSYPITGTSVKEDDITLPPPPLQYRRRGQRGLRAHLTT